MGKVAVEGSRRYVHFSRVQPGRARVVTASNDQTARVWDAKTGELVAQFFHNLTGLQHQFPNPFHCKDLRIRPLIFSSPCQRSYADSWH